MTVIDNEVIENFFESLQNTERDFLIFEGFEHYMELNYEELESIMIMRVRKSTPN
jgi:hypothetical protein